MNKLGNNVGAYNTDNSGHLDSLRTEAPGGNNPSAAAREKMTAVAALSESDSVKRDTEVGTKQASTDEDEEEASLPIAKSPVRSRGRSNSISAEDLARDRETASEKKGSQSSVAGSNEGPKKVKRKKKKASERMRPQSHSPRKMAENNGKPLMDLRAILQKHEKKSETQEMYDDNSVSSDFYGSLSSIPFLHPDKEDEKKPRKGKRSKKKESTSSSSERKSSSHKKEDSKKETEITVTKEYTDADVQLWKSMSAIDGAFMEEASHRPDTFFPVTQSTPHENENKVVETSPVKHNERGFHRPDDWVECDNPNKRNTKKKSYHSKNSKTQNDAPDDAALTNKEDKSIDTKASKPFQKDERGNQPQALDSSPENQASTAAPTKEKKYKKTSLSIAFPDGCVIGGDFRPKERIERVIGDLKKDLLRSDVSLPDFELFKKASDCEERTCLDLKATLLDAELVPAGTVYVVWKDPLDDTKSSPGWYLNSAD